MHDQESKLKDSAVAIRDVAVSLSNATSYDDANQKLADLKTSMSGTTVNPSSTSDQDWSKLVRNRALMDLLREKSDQIRKSLRRIKDPEAESRNASTMAVIGIAVGSHADSRKTPAEQMMWTDGRTISEADDQNSSGHPRTRFGRSPGTLHRRSGRV